MTELSRTCGVVIVGAGQAGLQTALRLRARGHEGSITLIGEEPYPPYQRPPLSKAYLKGEADEERLFLRPAPFYADQSIRLLTETRVARIDREARAVVAEDGRRFDYDALVLATGATPRALPCPGADLAGVLALRTLADARRLKAAIDGAARAVVVGGGYIGLEAAAVLRGLGREVTLLEAAPRVLARVAGETISDWFEALHRARGVRVETGLGAAAAEGEDGRVSAVVAGSGERIPADLVVVGIGVAPDDVLAREAGLDCDDGVLTDADCRTSDPAIFAAGDCARRALPRYGSARLESVDNALAQGDRVAAAILGAPAPAGDPPWFWSDQYEVKLQTAGLSRGASREVVRGDPASGRFAVFYFDGAEALLAVDAVSDPVSFLAAKKILKTGAALSPERARDPGFDLRTAS